MKKNDTASDLKVFQVTNNGNQDLSFHRYEPVNGNERRVSDVFKNNITFMARKSRLVQEDILEELKKDNAFMKLLDAGDLSVMSA